jgi:hypothetical protein
LDLPRGEGSVGLQEILRLLVAGRVGNSIGVGGVLLEGGGFGREAVGSDLNRWLSRLKRLKESAVNSKR